MTEMWDWELQWVPTEATCRQSVDGLLAGIELLSKSHQRDSLSQKKQHLVLNLSPNDSTTGKRTD